MIHDLRGTVLGERRGPFVHPRYDGWSFANIPSTLLSLFGVDAGRQLLDEQVLRSLRAKRFEHVLLLLIDGLGFDNWVERAVKYPFFRLIGERGSVTSLTAVFPSTTSAALTTLSTGILPCEHGLPEWNVYLEEIDDIITTLPFKRSSSKERDSLLREGIDASILFAATTIYERLAGKGILSVRVSKLEYCASAYSLASHRGARPAGYRDPLDLLRCLAAELEGAETPTFFYVYWDGFDALSHAHGPRSPQAELELEGLSILFLERLIRGLRRDVLDKVLLLIAADHGQVGVVPSRTIYLTDHPEVVSALRPGRKLERILPTGSMRDVFLHIRPGKVDESRAFLSRLLEGKAEVLTTAEAFARGLFGAVPASERFLRRIGDLLILPYPDVTVWAQYPGEPRPHKMLGHHGGLTPEEMFVPFGEVMMGELRGT